MALDLRGGEEWEGSEACHHSPPGKREEALRKRSGKVR